MRLPLATTRQTTTKGDRVEGEEQEASMESDYGEEREEGGGIASLYVPSGLQ